MSRSSFAGERGLTIGDKLGDHATGLRTLSGVVAFLTPPPPNVAIALAVTGAVVATIAGAKGNKGAAWPASGTAPSVLCSRPKRSVLIIESTVAGNVDGDNTFCVGGPTFTRSMAGGATASVTTGADISAAPVMLQVFSNASGMLLCRTTKLV